MGPCAGVRGQAVLYGVEPTIFHMLAVILIPPNMMLPIPPLPHPAFLSGHMAWPHMALGHRAGKPGFDNAPTGGVIIVWQCPNGVQVVGQDDDGVNGKGPLGHGGGESVAEGFDVID